MDSKTSAHLYEPVHETTNNFGFRPGVTQSRLYSHRRWIEPGNFGFRKKGNCTFRVAKTKVLISFAVTAKLICVFVFAYADCWFSHAAAHILGSCYLLLLSNVLKFFDPKFLVPKEVAGTLRKHAHAIYRHSFGCKKSKISLEIFIIFFLFLLKT